MQNLTLKSLTLLPRRASCLALGLAFGFTLAALPAAAEKADRDKPMFWTSDQPSEVSPEGGGELKGNVVISQGTLRLTADRVKVELPPDGFHRFFAFSTGENKQVEFRQARDKSGEIVVGLADRVEYDTKADAVRLIGHAVMRVLRGALVVNEVSSALLIYDKRTETYRLDPGESASQSNGRNRMMILPRDAGASQPASAASGVPLQPSTQIQPRKGS